MQTIIQTPTPALGNSLHFYQTLGFEVISANEPTVVTDGKVVIEINPDRFARAGVQLYQDNWSAILPQLEAITPVTKTDTGYLLSDPSGTWIYLFEGAPAINLPQPQEASSALGAYAGLSLETTDIQRSLTLWNTLGFKQSMGSVDQGWIGLVNDDGHTVSLMVPMSCPHLFFNPSLTYFNGGNNPQIIEHIRRLQIPITEEITHFSPTGEVDNIIVRDPGGYGFFIFND